MSKFEPVLMVSRDGREFTAGSAVELNNLVASGYKRKNSKKEVPEPVVFPSDDAYPVSTEDEPEKAEPVEEKPVDKPRRNARVSK